MADSVISKQELIDAQKDVKNAGEAVNTKKVITPRYGDPFKSIPLVVEEGEQKTAAAVAVLNAKANEVVAKGFYTGYATETALKASLPDVSEMRARADDTRKIWRWNRTSAEGVTPVTGTWVDTGPSDVDKAVEEFLIEAQKQGVALDQLDDYYNYLMQRLAQIAVDKGWDASFVVDGNKTQKQINDATIFNTSDIASIERINGQVASLEGSIYKLDTSDVDTPDNFFKIDAITGAWNWLPSHFNMPCVFAKTIKTDGTDQLATLQQYASYAASKRLKLVLPAGTITINDEFVPPSGLTMVGINESASGGDFMDLSGTVLKWGGANGAGKAALRCSTAPIGTTPTIPISGVKIKGIAINATGCDYGAYFRYFTNESSADEIVVSGANKCNIAGYQLWFCWFGKMISINANNVGICFGHALSGETGDLAVNGIDFQYIRAHSSGKGGTYNPNTLRYDGAGLIVNTQGCSYGNVQSEANGGIGIIDLSASRVNNWPNIYLESNAKTDTSATLKPSMLIYRTTSVPNMRIGTLTLAGNQQIVNESGGAVYLDNARTVGSTFAALAGTGGFAIAGGAFTITSGLSSTEYRAQVKTVITRLLEVKNLNLRYTSQLPQTYFQTSKEIGYPFLVLVSRNSYSGGGSLTINIDGVSPTTVDLSTGVSAGQVIMNRRIKILKGLHYITATVGSTADFYCDLYVAYGETDGGDVADWIDF